MNLNWNKPVLVDYGDVAGWEKAFTSVRPSGTSPSKWGKTVENLRNDHNLENYSRGTFEVLKKI